MSGIVGILHLDASPVDASLLARLNAFHAFRGPDGGQTWCQGSVGLGHARLHTTGAAPHPEPCTLDGSAWITADARVDHREALLAALPAPPAQRPGAPPDAELILRAYAAWGERCVEHLLGDFAFAIWDARARHLFCARDPFGVKPFFYVHLGSRFLFSNTLDCLRMVPGVSDRLNDQAIADFLLFGFNHDLGTTAFAEIRRLPPAHTLSVTPEGLRLRRYWQLPVEDELRYRNPADYVEEFRHLLARAVDDRLRASRAAVLMSGGLDSCSVAAVARRASGPAGSPLDLHAFTLVSERLFPDEERRYAASAARALEIPVSWIPVDPFDLYAGWADADLPLPEPYNEPSAAIQQGQFGPAARHARVALTGQGGDPAFSTSVTRYAARRIRERRYARLVADFSRFLAAEGRLSRLYLRRRFGIWRARRQPLPELPAWLSPALRKRLDLDARWNRLLASPPAEHPLRPEAYGSLAGPFWPYLFEFGDPGSTRLPLECRHPYFDLRLLRFLLRVPPVPWCTDKELLRVALRGMLPDEVRLRGKSPLRVDPTLVLLRRRDDRWWEKVPPHPQLAAYVRWGRVPHLTGREAPSDAAVHLGPFSLNLWLHFRGGRAPQAAGPAEERASEPAPLRAG